jgi:serine/threonine protein kinase
MGQVFLAEHLVLGRRAAIKVLHPELCRESEAVGRFFNEARASASLHHPGLIDVYDFGRDEQGNAFIVMELLEGVSLRDLLTREKILPPSLAIGLARQVADAMSAAHAHGIAHRDLKP